MDKDRKTSTWIIGGMLLLIVICACASGISSYIYRKELIAWLGLAPPQQVAKMLPVDTQFYMVTNPNVQNLPGYQNLKGLYLDNPEIQALLDEFESEVSGETDITFEENIKPWLGNEIAVAVTDLSDAITASDPLSLVLAAQTANEEASNEFINKLLARAAEVDQPFSDAIYQDVTLHIQENQFSREKLLLTTFNKFVVFSNSESLVKEMIDRAQGNNRAPALKDNDLFQKITNDLPTEALLTLYVVTSNLLDDILAGSAVELPVEQVRNMEAFEALGVAGTLQSNGIQFDLVMAYDLEKMSDQNKALLRQPASPNQILSEIPADAIFVYNINNLNNFWKQARQGLETNPDFSETLQAFEQEVEIDIDNDIFSWMTGEFALVLLEVDPPNEFTPPLGGFYLIGTDDVDGARSHVEKVMSVMENQGTFPTPLETQTIGGIEMKVFTDFDGAVQGGYGFHNSYFLLAYLEDSIMAAASAAENPLVNSNNFKAVQNYLPRSNYGYMYVDLEHGRRLMESQLGDPERADYNKNVRPFLEPLHAIGVSVSTEGVEKGVTKGVLFMLLTE